MTHFMRVRRTTKTSAGRSPRRGPRCLAVLAAAGLLALLGLTASPHWDRTCRHLNVTLTDGTTHTADFRFH